MRKNSGNVLLIILVLAGILTASVGGYFEWSSKTSTPTDKQIQSIPDLKSKEVTPSTDEMANWKTYTNTSFGVSFKYPPEWNLKETSYGVGTEIEPDIRMVVGACPGYVFGVDIRLDPYERQESFLPVTSSVLDNQPVEVFENNDEFGCLRKRIYVNKFPRSGYVPKLIISAGGKKSRVIFDQILSTFKFL